MAIDVDGLVDALPGLVWTTSADGRIDYVNRRWREFTGLGEAATRDRGWQAAIHPDDLDPALQAWQAMRTTGVAAEIDARLRRHDGEYRWFVFRLSRLSEAASEDQKWCWLGLEADETGTGPDHPMPDGRLRRLMDTLPAQILFLTPDMRLEYVNREVRDFYGRSTEALSLWDSSGDIHPDDVPVTFERVERLLKSGEPWDYQNRMRRADGTYRWVRSRMVPSRDAQGNIVRYCSIQTDVHDLKQAEDLLAGEVRLLEMVALGSPLRDVLEALSLLVEEIATGCLCSILTISPDRKHFQALAGPSLPEAYNAMLDGLTIDPGYGPCSLAVIEQTPVVTADPQNDPRWAGSTWPALIHSHDLRSCWSVPIISSAGGVCGIFALYRREPVGPTSEERTLIDRFAKIAGIAIDRALAEEVLLAREAELRRANVQLSEGQRLSMTGTFTADLRLDQHEWSQEYYRIFEIDPAARPNLELVRQRVHPDDLALFDSKIQLASEGGDPDFTFRIVTPSGVLKHVRGIARLIEHQEGRPIFMGAIQDITASTVAEEEVRRSKAYLVEGQRLAKTGSFFWSMGEDEPVFSDELRRIFDFEDNEPVTFERILERVHPDDAEQANEEMAAAIGGRHNDWVFRILMPDGAVKYLRSFTRGARAEGGRTELTGSIQDITETQLAQAALSANQAELRQAYDYLTEAQRLSKTGSFTWDVVNDEHTWSSEIRRIYGFDPDVRVTIEMIRSAVHPDDLAEVERVVGGAVEGRDFDLVFRIRLPDGEVRHAHVVGHRIQHIVDRPVFLGAMQDVTERVSGEEALNRARMQLAHVSRVTALSALTASIAHEVNQPLAGIITNASTCLRMLAADPPDNEGARATAQRTIRDANRASEVIKRLRALFTRKQPGAEPVDLNDATREVLTLSSAELQGARVILHTAFAEDLPIIRGDRVQLQQVILNLVLNAAEAMRTIGGRPHDLRIATTRDGDGGVLLSVRDCGVGASAEQLAQLFDAFYTTRPEGMGVGLSISRSIIEAHDGRLWASPNDDNGLTLFVSLPVGARDDERQDPKRAETVSVARSDNVQA